MPRKPAKKPARTSSPPRPARTAPRKNKATAPDPNLDEDEALDPESGEDGVDTGAEDLDSRGPGDPGSAQETHDGAAAARIGHSIHAHLEALHMTEPARAIELVEELIPVAAELAELAKDFEILGASGLAQDLRLAADRQGQRQRAFR